MNFSVKDEDDARNILNVVYDGVDDMVNNINHFNETRNTYPSQHFSIKRNPPFFEECLLLLLEKLTKDCQTFNRGTFH